MERFWFQQFVKSHSPVDYPYLLQTFNDRENSIPSNYYGKTASEEATLFAFVKDLCKQYVGENTSWGSANHSGPYLEILREIMFSLDPKSYTLINIDVKRDSKIKNKRVDFHPILRENYNFDEDRKIKREDDTIAKDTGQYQNSNDYWKNVLEDVIEQSPQIKDLIKTELLIYWRLSKSKNNLFELEDDYTLIDDSD